MRENISDIRGLRFHGLLTDLDNTLYDFAAAMETACSAVIRCIGTGRPGDLIRTFLFSPHGVESHLAIRDYLIELNLMDDDLYGHACTIFDDAKKKAVVPYPGVLESLRFISEAGIRIGAVTNASSLHAHHRMDLIGVLDLISVLISPDSSGVRKPDPAMYILGAEQLSLLPVDICVIGDNLTNDIAPAQKIGMFAVYARYGDRMPPEFAGDAIPDGVVNSFSDLIPLLFDR
ncbi:MAG TPA: HAD family hydrolase [Methanospirillum sp.]|nr:HAD family hydrolase [Methanospirillum sp.]